MNSATAGRISRFFNFRGSSEMIDTACSSSLVAVHRACLDLLHHESDYSIVGGVRLMLFPGENKNEQRLEIESPGGKCKTFSKDADGIGSLEQLLQSFAPVSDSGSDGGGLRGASPAPASEQMSLDLGDPPGDA